MKYVWAPAPGSDNWVVVVDEGSPSAPMIENYIILNNLTVGASHELDVYMGCSSFSNPLLNTTSEQVNTALLSIDNTYLPQQIGGFTSTEGTFTVQLINETTTCKLISFTTDIFIQSGFSISPSFFTPYGFPVPTETSSSVMTLPQSITGSYWYTCNWILVVYNPTGSYQTVTVYFQRNLVNNFAVAQATIIPPGATVNMPITIDYMPNPGDAIIFAIS